MPVVVSGREAVLRILPRLRILADVCGQPELASSLEHFLDRRYVGSKSPHLLLFTPSDQPQHVSTTIAGAVLVYQYRFLGMPLRIFLTEDVHGERNVLAPSAMRSSFALRAATYLMQHRKAHVAIVSVRDGAFLPSPPGNGARPGQRWAISQRTGQRYLLLGSTYEETLATLGPDTRRNFRRSLRKAQLDLGCVFVPRAEISLPQFLALDAVCDYPVTVDIANWRFRTAHAAGAVIAGLRAADGTWLSLVGGRRLHGTFAIDWQMNRTSFRAYSPSTVMRACLIQQEHELGTRQLLFEGGTPHAMSASLRKDSVTDLIAVSGSLPFRLMQRHVAHRLPTYNFLRQTMQQRLDWHTGMTTAPELKTPL